MDVTIGVTYMYRIVIPDEELSKNPILARNEAQRKAEQMPSALIAEMGKLESVWTHSAEAIPGTGAYDNDNEDEE